MEEIVSGSFAIVSNNCWGGEVYRSYGFRFNTPFVGLLIHPACYLTLLQDFGHFMGSRLSFSDVSKYYTARRDYPVGLLDEQVEIHFIHYPSREKAEEKWKRRLERMLKFEGVLHFKFDDRRRCSAEQMQQFHSLLLPNKVSFSVQEHVDFPDNVVIPLPGARNVMDGFELFVASLNYFDLEAWLRREGVKKRVSLSSAGDPLANHLQLS